MTSQNETLRRTIQHEAALYSYNILTIIMFKIMLHNPVETVKMTSYASIIEPGKQTRIAVNPNVKRSSLDIKALPIEKRTCYFEGERYLRYYRTYSQRSCIDECEANYTRDNCDCVFPFMPSNNINNFVMNVFFFQIFV